MPSKQPVIILDCQAGLNALYTCAISCLTLKSEYLNQIAQSFVIRQRLRSSMLGTCGARSLQILAMDGHMTTRTIAGSNNSDPVPLIHGRFGYGVPKAQQNKIMLGERWRTALPIILPPLMPLLLWRTKPQPTVTTIAKSAGHNIYDESRCGVNDDDPGGGSVWYCGWLFGHFRRLPRRL